MKILVLMNGDARRFADSAYCSYKPFIKVEDKTIVELTLSSLPISDHELYFAIRKSHNDLFDVENILRKKFNNVKIIEFEKSTRGNLETALMSYEKISMEGDEPLLILDSDNYYNGAGFFDFISSKTEEEFASLCCFEPIDDSDKWCFVIEENNKVVEIKEKDRDILHRGGKPLVGVFYFNKSSIFKREAEKIIKRKIMVKNEFYVSQIFKNFIKHDIIPVFVYKTDKAVPLGTPEDIRKVEDGKQTLF